ncbi:tRNA (adenosine(37)-N6)-threonylcarbamoyltransferase complex ATPase subunit type 1 TsaE [Patescibacteria group bacterium]|nr:MAG: tRNA (adenosine(37)-N6)-threonylcarbamoyltransferase complex ATPase subunit type 1 TsaE [Patescibacteria group bacterium]
MQRQWRSEREEDTEAAGAIIGQRLKGGEVVELRSDVGGGKTVFTRGLARGAGSTDTVASPTFTITKQYTVPDGRAVQQIVHADMYRLQDPGIMRHELADAVDADTVLVVEWADNIRGVLPDERLVVEIVPNADGSRTIHCEAPDSLQYVLEESS